MGTFLIPEEGNRGSGRWVEFAQLCLLRAQWLSQGQATIGKGCDGPVPCAKSWNQFPKIQTLYLINS